MKPSTDTTITKHKNAKAMMITSMAIFGTLGIFTRNIAVTSGGTRSISGSIGYFINCSISGVCKTEHKSQSIKKRTGSLIIFRSSNRNQLDLAF